MVLPHLPPEICQPNVILLISGHYIRYDLNMPKSIYKRKGGPADFHNDSPLTVQGHFQAKLVGESINIISPLNPLRHIHT